jgi:hypothetical protein
VWKKRSLLNGDAEMIRRASVPRLTGIKAVLNLEDKFVREKIVHSKIAEQRQRG